MPWWESKDADRFLKGLMGDWIRVRRSLPDPGTFKPAGDGKPPTSGRGVPDPDGTPAQEPREGPVQD